MHGLDTDGYRELYGLPTSFPLISTDLKELRAQLAREQYPNNDGLRGVKRDRRWRRRHRQGMEESWDANQNRPGFLDVFEQAQQRAAHTRKQANRQRYDRAAAERGYRDLPDLLARTWTATDLALGAILGVSESMAGYLRAHYGKRPHAEKSGPARRALQYTRAIDLRYDQRAQAAGYRGITEMLHRTRTLMNRELADLLGVSPQAVSRLRNDPTMARLRPGDGTPIKPTAQLRKRRAAAKTAHR